MPRSKATVASITTDSALGDLKGQTQRGGIVRVAAQFVLMALRLAATTVLARLLTPEDFGLFALVTTVTALIESFRDFGLPMALIHQKTLDEGQLDALFRLSVRLNVILTGVFVVTSPLLAAFYDDSRLIPMAVVCAAALFVVSLTASHEGLLIRQLKFGLVTKIEIGAMFFSLVAAIGAAFVGAGYWALVVQYVTMMGIRSLWTWLACPWRPRLRGATAVDASLAGIVSYSRELTASRILNYLTRNIDTVSVGYFVGSAAVGLYDRAYQWTQVPVRQLHGSLLSVAVASLSRVRHDVELYKQYCRTVLLPVFALGLPPLVFMFIEAENVVMLLLGEQWEQAVPLFRLMAIAAYVGSMNTVTRWLYLAEGQTRRLLQWNLLSLPVMAAAVLWGAQGGVYGIGLAFTLATCGLTYPGVVYCLKTSPLTLRSFWGIVWRPLVASLLAGLVVFAMNTWLPSAEQLALALATRLLTFTLAYLGAWLLLPGGHLFLAQALNALRQPTVHS